MAVRRSETTVGWLRAEWRTRAGKLARELDARGLREGWVALSERLSYAGDAVEAFTALPHPRAFWRDRGDISAWVAAGEAGRWPLPMSQLADVWRSTANAIVAEPGCRVRALVGAAFNEASVAPPWTAWPPGMLWLPAVAATVAGDELDIVVCLPVRWNGGEWEPDDGVLNTALDMVARWRQAPALSMADAEPRWAQETVSVPDMATWLRVAEAAVAALRGGALRKVVLARAVGRGLRGAWTPAPTVQRLLTHAEHAYVFAVDTGDGCFLGATPERLCAVRGRIVHVDALAGSRPRGRDEAEDKALAQALCDSGKDLEEHRRVVDWIDVALRAVAENVVHPPAPKVRRLRYIQHLYTPVQAVLQPGNSALDVAARLHPTPAVAGVPQLDAMDWIASHEPVVRGWYAGPIGWVDTTGDGELAVALRSALVQDGMAWLFAGVGLVTGSDPVSEWDETRWKLRPMVQALGWPEQEVPET